MSTHPGFDLERAAAAVRELLLAVGEDPDREGLQDTPMRVAKAYTEAFADYARMLANSPRYAGVVRGASTAESFAGGMQRAGYATDPQYANKLSRTINQALSIQRAMG